MVNRRRQCGNNDATRINTSRRMYRGRSGPQDGNLPPPRRRRDRTRKEQMDDTDAEESHQQQDGEVNPTNKGDINTFYESEEEEESDFIVIDDAKNNEGSKNSPDQRQENSKTENNTATAALDEELQHLQKRIKHVRESIQQSNSLHNPTIWEENCLNPVRNVVLEWRSIVSHYGNVTLHDHDENSGEDYEEKQHEEEEEDDERIFDVTKSKSKNMALEVFQLLQMSMQCGPLVGSKPAYFRRCGVQVVKMAYSFLCDALVPNDTMKLLEKRKNGFFPLEALMVPLQQDEKMENDGAKEKCEEKGCNVDENDDSGSEDDEEDYALILKQKKEKSNDDSSDEIAKDDQTDDDDDDEDDEPTHPQPHYTPQETPPTKSVTTQLRFTQRQANTIQSWIKDAQKAISKNKAPSKSAIKLQEKGGSKKKLKKKHDTEKRRRGKGRKKKYVMEWE